MASNEDELNKQQKYFQNLKFIQKYLDEDDVDTILKVYDASVLENIEPDNFEKIIAYLQKEAIDYIEDIIVTYLDIFLLDALEFQKRWEKLKKQYGNNYYHILKENMEILEEVLW